MKSEFELIEFLKKKIPRRLQGSLGIGDDTAVLSREGKGPLLFASDVLVEGVDFLSGKASAESVGHKALAVNLSDIAAMGGKPSACVISLGIPKNLSTDWIKKFYAGLLQLADKYDTLCAGGDISRAKEFFVSVAILGHPQGRRAITRGGARPGNLIAVTGKLGGSILGHHLTFEPRLKEAQFLAKNFSPAAMIDISDGLWQDLEHILKKSKVSAEVDLAKIPVSREAFKLARGNSSKAVEHAVTDGEDFELLFTVPQNKKESLSRAWRKRFPKVSLSWIGSIRKGRPEVVWTQKGKRVSFHPRQKGFSHF